MSTPARICVQLTCIILCSYTLSGAEQPGQVRIIGSAWRADEGELHRAEFVPLRLMALTTTDAGAERLDLNWTNPLRYDLSPNVAFAQFLPDRLIVVRGDDTEGCRARITNAAGPGEEKDFVGLWRQFPPAVFTDAAAISDIMSAPAEQWKRPLDKDRGALHAAALSVANDSETAESRHLELTVDDGTISADRADLMVEGNAAALRAFQAEYDSGNMVQSWRYQVLEWTSVPEGEDVSIPLPRVILFEQEFRYPYHPERDVVSALVAVVSHDNADNTELSSFEELLPRTRVADLINKRAYVVGKEDGDCVARQFITDSAKDAGVLYGYLSTAPSEWCGDTPRQFVDVSRKDSGSQFAVCRIQEPLIQQSELIPGDESGVDVLSLAEVIVAESLVERRTPVGFIPTPAEVQRDSRMMYFIVLTILVSCLCGLIYLSVFGISRHGRSDTSVAQ